MPSSPAWRGRDAGATTGSIPYSRDPGAGPHGRRTMPETSPDNHREASQQRPEGNADHEVRTHPTSGGTGCRVRVFRKSRWRRVGNAIAGRLARAGIGPFWLLTTRGRKSGRPYTNPVTLVKPRERSPSAADATAATTPSARLPPTRPHRSSSVTSRSFVSRDRTSRRAGMPRWRTSSPRRTATPCSSSAPSVRTRRNRRGGMMASTLASSRVLRLARGERR